MSLFDRYVLGLFIKIMFVCFCSLAGLYLIIDVFNHLDDFIQIGKRDGSLWRVLIHYYGPRLIGLFCEVSGLLCLLAAICTLTRLQTTQELAAVQAAGISTRRVARPLLYLTAGLCLATLGARELVLPRFRTVLLANSQEILKDQPQRVVSQIDYETLVMFRGQEIDPATGIILYPDLLLPHDWTAVWGQITEASVARSISSPIGPNEEGSEVASAAVTPIRNQIKARAAVWQPANELHPAGFLLEQAQLPSGSHLPPSIFQEGHGRLLLPSDQAWLQSGQCFVPTHLSVWQLAYGAEWFRSATLAELVSVNQSGSVRLPSIQRVEIHWRLIRPAVDFLVLLIGLPLVLRPGGQKLVIAAGYCALLMLGVQLMVMACHFLGGQQILKPAAIAAWLPVLILVPIATWAYQRFDY